MNIGTGPNPALSLVSCCDIAGITIGWDARCSGSRGNLLSIVQGRLGSGSKDEEGGGYGCT